MIASFSCQKKLKSRKRRGVWWGSGMVVSNQRQRVMRVRARVTITFVDRKDTKRETASTTYGA